MKDKKNVIKTYESLPKDIQEFLKDSFKNAKNEKDFIGIIMVGDCPKCGGENTRDCEDSPLGDITVGICLDCYIIWCLECEEIFKEGQNICAHWEICDKCKFSTDEGCDILIDECSIIQDWKNDVPGPYRRLTQGEIEGSVKKIKTWTDNKEDFVMLIRDGEYHISKDLQLIESTMIECGMYDRNDSIDTIWIGDAYHTTSRLRQFCDEFHPEVDFDYEFETDQPGVYARYQERFGYDYPEWVQEQIYKELKEALKEKGYILPFD